MVDVMPTARYYDAVFESELTCTGLRQIDDEVVVEFVYAGSSNTSRVPLAKFRADPDIEMIEEPEYESDI